MAEAGKNLVLHLRDMRQDRQYVAGWEDGALQGVIALDEKGRVPLTPGEKLFAICDAVSIIPHEGKFIASTFGAEISVDAQGKAASVRLLPLEYDVEHEVKGDRLELHYLLTGTSAEALSELGMDVAGLWETKFSRSLKDADPSDPDTAFIPGPRYEVPLYPLHTTTPVTVRAPLKFRKPGVSL